MKLLLDANLSHHLVEALEGRFPGSAHVRSLGLERASDLELWAYAAERGYVIVSKDEDFAERALLQGPPPKVVWVRLGNCTTADIEALFRVHRGELVNFAEESTAPLLALP